MYLYLNIYSLMVIFLYASSIEAASTFSDGRNFPRPIRVYPTQEEQTLTLQQQQQYIPYRPLQRDNNGYGFQNSYPYQTLGDQYNNYNNVQPTGISFTQSQSQLPTEQLYPQQQQQRFPYLINRPKSTNHPTVQYDPVISSVDNQYSNLGYQSLRTNDYQRSNFRYVPQNGDDSYYGQNQISLPSSRESTLFFDRNSIVPLQTNRLSTPVDYAMLFERYLRKYPERLQPTYSGNRYGK